MSPTDEMMQPATKGDLYELRKELRNELRNDFATKGDLYELRNDFDRKLELWGGALMARIDERAERTERLLMDQFARWAKAIDESVRSYIGVLDDKYRDLPPRVTRLETKVFPPKRMRRR